MITRRPYRRRPKDILNLALKSLAPKEELLCTSKTFDAINERVALFYSVNPTQKYAVTPWDGVKKIKRLA
jgi:hypothetical protein